MWNFEDKLLLIASIFQDPPDNTEEPDPVASVLHRFWQCYSEIQSNPTGNLNFPDKFFFN